ncbi:unnamed protein product [Discula destructiva]
MCLKRVNLLLSIPVALVVNLFLVGCNAAGCTANQRQSWSNMSTREKRAYIDAELCLISSPPRNGLRGAWSRFEELQWVHLEQLNFIHGVGAFLYWHRYLMTVHERLLQTECGYRGAQPYWNEMADIHSLANSEVFDAYTGFGGNGASGAGCVADGPFAGLVLHLNSDYESRPYCLWRNFDQRQFSAAAPANVNECYGMATFNDAWPCYEGHPHDAGHNGIGGVMADVAIAPGDPIFYLHHAYLDKLFWEWQQAAERGLEAVGGPNRQVGVQNSQPMPDSAFTTNNGDNGTSTTAGHVLWMAGIMENVTISDVMDLTGDVICAEYL